MPTSCLIEGGVGMSTKAIKVWLREEQVRALKRLAKEQGESVSALVRKAVDKVYGSAEKSRKKRALRKLFSLDAPVNEWPQIEKEIERDAVEP